MVNIFKKKRKNHFIKYNNKKNFFDKIKENIEILAKINFNISYKQVLIILGVLALIGVLLGILFKNMLLSILFGFTFPLGFNEFLFIKKKEVERYIDFNIINCAEIIKNNYVSTLNINKSISTSIERFPKPLKEAFEDYLKEVNTFNFPTETALNNIAGKFNSSALNDFIKQLILCDKDSRYVTSLSTTVASLNDRKLFLSQWIYIEKSIYEKLIAMIIMINVLVFANYYILKDMVEVFLKHPTSKIIIPIYILVQIITIYIINQNIKKVKM